MKVESQNCNESWDLQKWTVALETNFPPSRLHPVKIGRLTAVELVMGAVVASKRLAWLDKMLVGSDFLAAFLGSSAASAFCCFFSQNERSR